MHFEFYRDERNEWRWTLIAANGRTIADSGEGYKNQGDMLKGIALVRGSATIPTRPRKPLSKEMLAAALMKAT
jgi:uncharacterized protein YegP (UPF0339 family)